MSTLTIALSEDGYRSWRKLPGVSDSRRKIVRVSIDELLSLPEEDFPPALEQVLSKNAGLYSAWRDRYLKRQRSIVRPEILARPGR